MEQLKTITDAAGTPLSPGDRILWSPATSKKPTLRKGVYLGTSTERTYRGESVTTAEFAVLVSTHYARAGRYRHSVQRRRTGIGRSADSAIRLAAVVKADYTLTDGELSALRTKTYRQPAHQIWGL